MNRYKIKIRTCILLIACLTTMGACRDSYFPGTGDDESSKSQINISSRYGTLTRASDAGFSDNDVMGIFITDYENNSPSSLGEDDIHAKNIGFTYSETTDRWTGATQLYWNDSSTPVDIYGYYPFESSMNSPLSHQFKVATRQNTPSSNGRMSAYEQSDFLWAKASGITPTSEVIELTYRHAMAGITIKLEAGSGFGADEFSKIEKIVWIDNTVPDAVINLETQTVVAAAGNCERIYPLSYNADYRAIVVPQTISAGKCIIGVNVDGKDYLLTKSDAFTFVQEKMHTFTIRVDKKSDSGDFEVKLMPASITSWIDDPSFHDGIMYEYQVVNVSEGGKLKDTLQALGMNASKITALKICGPLNADDRNFIGTDMENCSALNLAEAVMADDELSIWTANWMGDGHIKHIVYPNTPFKKLGNVGGKVRGNQIIPEGVEEIDGWVVETGTQVSFPSTLKHLGDIGVNREEESRYMTIEGLRGNLMLPEGLESYGVIGGYFTGMLILPESLKELGTIRGKFNSGLVIPPGIKKIPSEAFNRCSFMGPLSLPIGIEIIGHRGFESSGFTGELVLPETVKEIESRAFENNKFTSIIWPKNLCEIGNNAFEGCNRLQGTLVIPGKIHSINEATFKGCSMITSLELHKDIEYIGNEAFAGCERLTAITCMAETPPLATATAFEGVGMDHVVLEVPASSLNAYRSAPGWKEFKRITAYKDFSCYPSQIQALNAEKNQRIVVSTKGNWKLKSSPEWCSVSPTSGNGKTQVDITVKSLSSGADNRYGIVEFESTADAAVASVKVSQYKYDFEEDTAVRLQQHSKGNGIPVYLLGDGWTGEDIATGSFMEQCREDMEHFFGVAPYDRLRDYFDVYSIIALSQEKGVNTIYNYRDTRFSTIYSADYAQLLPDESLIFNYLKNETKGVSITDSDLSRGIVILIPNTTDYGSSTYYYEGTKTISVCPPTTNPYPMDNRGVIQHEACGHGFGKLGDEFISKNLFAPISATAQIESMHAKEWFMNLATTSNMNIVPWSDMIFDARYSDRVDIYEGGFGYTRGVFRSEANSCMNLGIPYFNSISRLYITKRILNVAGEVFNLNSFYNNDTFEWGNATTTRGFYTHDLDELPFHRGPVSLTAKESRTLLNKIRSQQNNNKQTK